MRSDVLDGVVERALQVLEHRRLVRRAVVERHVDLEEVHVAGLADIAADAEDEPQGVVVEVAANVRVSALGERLELVVRGAVLELGRGDVEEALAGAGRDLVHDAEHVLARVAEADAAADSGLEVRGRAREVIGDDALILIPHGHAVELLVAGLEGVIRKETVPEFLELVERGRDLSRGLEALLERDRLFLVDHAHRGIRLEKVLRRGSASVLASPLLIIIHLDITENEDEGLRGARLEVDIEAMARDGRPAVGDGVFALAGHDGVGGVVVVVESEEGLPIGVEAIGLGVNGVEREVVAPLAVLGLVIDRAAFDLDLAGGEVALEVRRVVERVVEAPLDVGDERHGLLGAGGIG